MDKVGNARNQARNVSLSSGGKYKFSDAIGGRDSNDYYRLRLRRSSDLDVSLTRLSADANLELLSRSGSLIQRSARSGIRSDSIRKTLDPGTYYLRVYPGSRKATKYSLRLSAPARVPDVVNPVPGAPGAPGAIGPGIDLILPPIAKSLTVTSPNGGNQLASGNSLSINWTDNFSENVRIDLYRGNTFDRNIVSSTESDGFFSWLAPSDLPGRSDYRLKITSVNDSQVTDFSDANFSIMPTVASNQWRAEFFNRTSGNYALNDWGINGSTYQTGIAQVTQNLGSNNSSGSIKARLYRDYQHNSPVAGINADYYAMWATTRMYLEVGRQYQIATDSDDGTAFYLKPSDSSSIRFLGDDWRNRSIAENTKLIPFTVSQSGFYDFGLKYFEGISGSIIDVTVRDLGSTGSTGSTGSNSNTAFIDEVVRLTNNFRAQNGLQPLTYDSRLGSAAQTHTSNMANQDFFSHTGIDGSSVGSRATASGYRWSTVGENIAAGQITPQAVVNSWINSPGHRANMLNPNYQNIGVGYVYLANDTGQVNYQHYWTQKFGRLS